MTADNSNLMIEADPEPRTHEVAAIILAAGQSQRMGAFKPLLPFGDKTVIETCIEHLRGGGAGPVIVVLGQGPHADRLKDHLKESCVTFAVNPDASSEMGASIACGVRQLPVQTKAVLITPADHPAVPSEVVALLIGQWKKGTRLLVPSWKDQGGHPVLVDLTFRDELLHLDPARGLKGLFEARQNQVGRVPVSSNYIARDMDTWDDYRALHKDVFGVLPHKQPLLEQN